MQNTIEVRALPIETRVRFAAYLRAVHNMSQSEIGTMLGGLSQPHVSRLLSRAEKSGLLVVEHRFRGDALSADDLEELKSLLAPSKLSDQLHAFCERYAVPVPGLAVYESGPGTTEAAMAQRRRRFGRMAAGRIVELLTGQKIAGVAWGRTIQAVVESIGTTQLRKAASNLEVIPLCAEILLTSQSGHSASRLAEELTKRVRGADGATLQLTGFPAYVPRSYDPTAQKAIWQLIRDTPNYEKIFSGPDSRVAQMDALVSSVGHIDDLVRGGFDDFARAAQVDRRSLPDLVVGDLGGLLIPRHGLSASKRALVDELNGMWTGISPEQVSRIASVASNEPHRPGVIVVALRAERASALLELIRLQWANELIIDEDAANGLGLLLAEKHS